MLFHAIDKVADKFFNDLENKTLMCQGIDTVEATDKELLDSDSEDDASEDASAEEEEEEQRPSSPLQRHRPHPPGASQRTTSPTTTPCERDAAAAGNTGEMKAFETSGASSVSTGVDA